MVETPFNIFDYSKISTLVKLSLKGAKKPNHEFSTSFH